MTSTTDTPAAGDEATRRTIKAPGRARKTADKNEVAARFDPGHRGEARRKNPVWLASGLLLVVLCSLGGVLLFMSTDERVQVLVTAENLEPGTAVSRDAFQIAEILPGDAAEVLSPGQIDAIVGLRPRGQIPAGTIINRAMFAEELSLKSNENVVGAALDPGEAPVSGVEVGTSVELFVTSSNSTPSATGERGAAAESIGIGTIWAAEELTSGKQWLSIRVTDQVALQASEAAAADKLRVVLRGEGQ